MIIETPKNILVSSIILKLEGIMIYPVVDVNVAMSTKYYGAKSTSFEEEEPQ